MKTSSLQSIASQLKAKPFRPLLYLKNRHKQTLAGILGNSRQEEKTLPLEKILFPLNKKTSLLLDCSYQAHPRKKPFLILVHGLEGSSSSHYMLRMAKKAYAQGWNIARVNLRSCGNTEAYTNNIYNAGQSQDINKVIRYFIKNNYTAIFLTGFSLGGNICLKLAGEWGEKFPKQVRGMAAVSPTVDLTASEKLIDSPQSSFYKKFLLASLKKRIQCMALAHPNIYNTALLKNIRTIKEFDAVYQVPMLKLKNVAEFYKKASSVSLLPKIALPTLIIHACDDPIAPITPLKNPEIAKNNNIITIFTKLGGHVGFIGKPYSKEDKFWAENRIIEFFTFLLRQQKSY